MIYDCHAHVFPERIVDRAMEALSAQYGVEPVARATPDGLLRHMDECGVDRALMLGVATKPSQVSDINTWLCSIGNDRLAPFGALHPFQDDLEDEIARLQDMTVKGIKLQPHFQDYDLQDPRVLHMFELIGDKLVVLLHAGQEILPIQNVQPTPPRLLRLHHQFPQIRFIFAHMGASSQWDQVEQYLVGEDVYFDASYVFDICSDPQIERIIRNHGPDKILWGSDFPWQPQSQGLAGMRRLGFAQHEIEAMLSGNLLRLLGESAT